MQAFLVCGLILFLSPFALSLKCEACGPDGAPCGGANVSSIDCEAGADRCMTVTMVKGQQTAMMKNCSSFAMVCQEQSLGYPCKPGGLPSGATCKVMCCEGDLCNKASPGGSAPTVVPTATVTVPAVSAKPTFNSTNFTIPDTPAGTEPPSAGVPEFTATFGAIFLGFVMASLPALE